MNLNTHLIDQKTFLQKYRLYLSRLPKTGDQNSSSNVIQQSDLVSKDPAASFSMQNPINRQQNDVSVDSHKYTDAALQLQSMNAISSHESNLKGIIPEVTMDKRTDSPANIHDTNNTRKSAQKINDQSFAPIDSALECTNPWREFPDMQVQKHQPYLPMKDRFSHLPLHDRDQHLIQVDHSPQADTSIISDTSVMERETAACIETNPLYTGYTSDYAGSVSSIRSAGDFSMQCKSFMGNKDRSLEPVSISSFDRKEGVNLNSSSDQEFHQQNFLSGEFTSAAHLDEDLKSFWMQGEHSGLQNIEIPECYYDPGLTGEVPIHLFDTAEYSAVDQGLFIV